MGHRHRAAFRLAGVTLLGLAGLGVTSVHAAGVDRPATDPREGERQATAQRAADPIPRKATPAPPAACADGMTLVEGDFCPRVEQSCLRWMDPPGRFHAYRCAEYALPAKCLAARVHRRFCIDRQERAEAETGLPLNRQSWNDAKSACEAAGARVCEDSEWTFACEGEEMRPYPYGWSREPSACNADHVDLLLPATHGHSGRLRDERERVGSHPDCVSPFGVLDMAGNVAEWVSVDGFAPGSVVVQKGNWWQPGKNACREEQPGHDRHYAGAETGFRCCAGAAPATSARAAASESRMANRIPER